MSLESKTSSQDSLESNQLDDLAPNAYTADYTDAQSEISPVGSRISTSTYGNNLRLTRTETVKSLQDVGLSSSIPIPSVVAPPVEHPIFPEEYTLETNTGLVKVQTLQSLGRTRTATDDKDEKFDPETEYVTFVFNDPENPQN